LGLVKSAEFEISEALGYHQIAFLESPLIGEFSGFLSRLYFNQRAGKIEAFSHPNKIIPPLAENQGAIRHLTFQGVGNKNVSTRMRFLLLFGSNFDFPLGQPVLKLIS
jgi:hypothetical protein